MHLNGIIPVDKPKGFTSFDVIAKLRGILKTKKIGHSGTLDPMATGVLPLFVGSATKAVGLLPPHKKKYIARCKLGVITDTLDSTGEVLSEKDPSAITKTQLLELLPSFTGNIQQIPPMYSAVKQNGKKLYQLARKGVEVERRPRPVTIYSLALLEFDNTKKEFTIEVLCSKGTYIRTLIDDLGSLLGCGAVMTALERTASEGFGVEACLTIEQIEQLTAQGKIEQKLLPVDRVLTDYDKITLPPKELRLFCNGVLLGKHQIPIFTTKYALVYSEAEVLVGVCYLNQEEQVRSKTFFNRIQ